MSHMICLECGEVYDPLYIKSSDFDSTLFCPKLSCGGRVIECDDLIMSTVFNLNRQGYTTFHSCSGHPGGKVSDTYISFNCLVTDMDKVIDTILSEYTYPFFNGTRYETGPLRFSVEGHIPETEYLYDRSTRSANFENWDEVKVDFENLKNRCTAKDLYPVLLVRPYTKNDILFPNYRGVHLKEYPVIGAARCVLRDINDALYTMTTRLPDELSLEDL